MKTKLSIVFICGIILFGICGCDKNINNSNDKEQININEKNDIEIENSITNKDDLKEDIPLKKEEETPIQNNTTNVDDKKQETIPDKEEGKENIGTPNEESNKKIVVCSISQTGDNYSAIIKLTTSFENDTIVYHTMYVEKAFDDSYKAEDDKAFEGITNEKLNNLNDGRNGSIHITNNTVYYTLNFDVKNYPNVITYVTKHTEYNDFLNHMTTNNGYSCITK